MCTGQVHDDRVGNYTLVIMQNISVTLATGGRDEIKILAESRGFQYWMNVAGVSSQLVQPSSCAKVALLHMSLRHCKLNDF